MKLQKPFIHVYPQTYKLHGVFSPSTHPVSVDILAQQSSSDSLRTYCATQGLPGDLCDFRDSMQANLVTCKRACGAV